MRILAAYLMAVLGGKESPSKADITKILGSVGIEVDETRVDKLLDELKGKDLDQVMAEGLKKMSSVPAVGGGGGGGGGAAPAAAGGAAPAAGGKKAEEKPAAKEKEKSEESEADLGFSLFD